MIKINLTPFEELDNPRWWVPDAMILGLVILLSIGGVYYYIVSAEQKIATIEAEKLGLMAETASLQGEVTKYSELNAKISLLDSRKNSLKRITESKLIRYLPVILLENIQNLKPEKVWLTGLAFVSQKKEESLQAAPPAPAAEGTPAEVPTPAVPAFNGETEFPITIELNGSAIDNIAIAEFMMALKATQNQSFEKSDLRSQLFFSDVAIAFSQVSTETGARPDVQPQFVSFKLILNFKEKLEGNQEGKFSQFIDQFKRTGRASIN